MADGVANGPTENPTPSPSSASRAQPLKPMTRNTKFWVSPPITRPLWKLLIYLLLCLEAGCTKTGFQPPTLLLYLLSARMTDKVWASPFLLLFSSGVSRHRQTPGCFPDIAQCLSPWSPRLRDKRCALHLYQRSCQFKQGSCLSQQFQVVKFRFRVSVAIIAASVYPILLFL